MLLSRIIKHKIWIGIFVFVGLIHQFTPCVASHIVGGQIEMQALGDRSGHFSVSVVYYFDENQSFVPRGDDPLPIYRKRDNQYMGYVVVYNQAIDKRPLLPFSNQPCASQRNLAISVVRYTGEAQLDPETYSDPQGYYITYQTCCRNAGIDNIQDPVNAGYVFYLEFPPLMRQNKPFLNSSPVFDPIDGEYICLGESFTFDFDAHDPDGDELSYSLITPLQGFQTTSGSQQVIAGPYPTVRWLPGFGPSNAIPGNPSLHIDPKSGQLSVTATQQGLFIFTVLVEEYRQGERIGAVQRDYQFLVVDCPPTSPPDPTITIDNKSTTSISFCQGHSAVLKATVNSNWDYQWKKDGVSIMEATKPFLTVTKSGVYQLITTLKDQCAKSRRSQKITVTVTSARFTLSHTQPLSLCGEGSSLPLTALSGSRSRYTWYRNGQRLSGERSATLQAEQPGQYWATVEDTVNACQSHSDTVLIRVGVPPTAILTSLGSMSALCPGDSLLLSASQGIGYSYQWQMNGDPIPAATGVMLKARQGGAYTVTVIDSAGCRTTSSKIDLIVVDGIRISMDSLPPVCGPVGTAPVLLQGYPAGGLFSGPGVVNGYFDAQRAGVGQHTLTYTLKAGELSCQQGTVSRVAIVQPNPIVNLGSSLAIWRGGVTLLPGTPQSGATYHWTPGNSLDDSTRVNPMAHPDQTTRYRLLVRDTFGCEGQDTITVHVYDRIWIPDAFSPNGDGVNDVWVLRGIDAYPDVEVTIFDRWGEVVYYSKGYNDPFNGRYKGQPLSSGVYTYTLRTNSNSTVNKGRVVLL